MSRISYSQLSMFSECPQRWKLNYIDKLTEVNIDDIWKTLSSHEVQAKSRILGGLDSNISTNEIISSKQINIQDSKSSSLIILAAISSFTSNISDSVKLIISFTFV